MKLRNWFCAMILTSAIALGCAGLGTSLAFAQEADPTIGIGQAATVTVTDVTSQDVTVTDVTEGQYFIYAKVTNPSFEKESDYYRINPYVWLGEYEEVEEGDTTVRYQVFYYLDYNEELKSYYTMIETASNKTISVYATYYNGEGETPIESVTMELELGNIALGEFNQNSLYGVKMPAQIALDNVSAGRYILAVTPEGSLTGAITAKIDDGTAIPLTYNDGMYGAYTAVIDVAANAKLLNIEASAGLVANVALYTYKTAKPLPVTNESFVVNESKVFSYTVSTSDYYTLNIVPSVAGAGFSVMLKSDPNDLEGEYMESGYPVNLSANTAYYFEITCYYIPWDGTGNEPTTLTANVSVEKYVLPTVIPGVTAFVPTSASYKLSLSAGLEGEFTINVLNVPFDVTSITLHYDNNTMTLTDANSFSSTIILTGVKEIYIEATPEFVAGVLIERMGENIMRLGMEVEMTLVAGESATYYLENLEEGVYSITIEYSDESEVFIVLDANGEVIVREGATEGEFTASIYDPDPDVHTIPVYALTFINNGASVQTAYVTVNSVA